MWERLLRKLGVALNLRDPPNLPAYGWSYFDHLNALYQTLNVQDTRIAVIIAKAAATPDLLNWGDIFAMESVIFSLQPDDVVNRTAWIYRERFREVTCGSIYQRYIESGIPTDTSTPAKTSLLRADLTRILDILHWYYSLMPMRERVRKALTVSCLRMVLGYTALLVIALFWCHSIGWQYLAMLFAVIYCGIIGGFVSSQRRMQGISSDADPLITVYGLDNAGYYLWLSPLLGAIFAVVLCFMFIAGFVEGTVFPEFSRFVGKSIGFFDFTWHALPKSNADYAKLFVWAFLAGFAERLVPDNLDRLAAKLATADKPQPAQLLPPTGGGGGADHAGIPNDPNAPPPPGSPRPQITEKTLRDMSHTGEIEEPREANTGKDDETAENK